MVSSKRSDWNVGKEIQVYSSTSKTIHFSLFNSKMGDSTNITLSISLHEIFRIQICISIYVDPQFLLPPESHYSLFHSFLNLLQNSEPNHVFYVPKLTGRKRKKKSQFRIALELFGLTFPFQNTFNALKWPAQKSKCGDAVTGQATTVVTTFPQFNCWTILQSCTIYTYPFSQAIAISSTCPLASFRNHPQHI